MRLLIIHNFYQDPGGEDMVFHQESTILADEDHQVKTLEFRNQKGFRGLLQFILYPWNFLAARRLNRVLKQFKPDLVHIHNVHYAAGPLLIRKIHKHNTPIVFTLHNYRLLCPSATLYHQGQLFTNSLSEKFPWTAVKKGVWSRSLLKTFWLALTVAIHHRLGTWNQVDRYFVLTEFAKNLFQSHLPDIDQEKWVVKPNFISETNEGTPHHRRLNPTNEKKRKPYLFVGRLSAEKGVRTLIEAFMALPHPVRIAGDGPLREELLERTKGHLNIQFLGTLTSTQIINEMSECEALIFPSEWFEGMPMTILEAFSCGTAVIASRLGAMETMIQHEENGLLFEAAQSAELMSTIKKWELLEDQEKEEIRKKAYASYAKLYSPEINKKMILRYYQEIIANHNNSHKRLKAGDKK